MVKYRVEPTPKVLRKLTLEQMADILLARQNGEKLRSIAARFGISNVRVHHICQDFRLVPVEGAAPEMQAQCWICPKCYGDHRQDSACDQVQG